MQQFAKKLRISIFNKMHGELLDADQISNAKYHAIYTSRYTTQSLLIPLQNEEIKFSNSCKVLDIDPDKIDVTCLETNILMRLFIL